jgi:Tol biopolymer transport system component
MAPALVSPQFLMQYDGSVSDYRCAVNKAGSTLVFERLEQGRYQLQLLDLTTPGAQPQPYMPGLNVSTRPDWSWTNGEIAFSNDGGVWHAAGTAGANPKLVDKTENMIYAAWNPDAQSLIVMNLRKSQDYPHPRTSRIGLKGKIEQQMMANGNVWAGMPAVNPTNPNRIVFAGQLIGSQTSYNQDLNYIWFVDNGTTPQTLRPLDQNAPTSGPFDPAFQGRAPWWSPNGQWVAFESTRASTSGLYAIFIQDSAGANPAMQVLDVQWNANHAKWFPSGTVLVATVLQASGKTARGIATLDVSGFVG